MNRIVFNINQFTQSYIVSIPWTELFNFLNNRFWFSHENDVFIVSKKDYRKIDEASA